jgi:hypothetical protein
MKTTLTTETFNISITEIISDYDNPTDFEISFESTLTPAYLHTTEYFTDGTAASNDDNFIDDITFKFNVAHRHGNGLYFIIKHDRSGDYYDSYESAIYAFGKPVIDFIDDACRLLKIPFYPNR